MTKQQPCHSELFVSSKTTKQIDVTFKIDVLELIPLKCLLLLLIWVCVYLVKSEIKSFRILFFPFALNWADSLPDDVAQGNQQICEKADFLGGGGDQYNYDDMTFA